MMRNTKLEGHIRGKRERITDESSARTPVLRKEDNISSKYLHLCMKFVVISRKCHTPHSTISKWH